MYQRLMRGEGGLTIADNTASRNGAESGLRLVSGGERRGKHLFRALWVGVAQWPLAFASGNQVCTREYNDDTNTHKYR